MKKYLFFKETDDSKNLYKVLCVVLGVLLCISAASFISSPSIGLESSDRTDISNSRWLDQLMKDKTDLYGMDFIESAGFSMQPAGGKIVVLYASEKPVSDVRDYYKKQRNAIENGRNDETALNLEMDTDAGRAKLVNYYSGVCQVYEMTLYLKKDIAARYGDCLEKSIPEQSIRKALSGTELGTGKKYGEYVRYLYDDMDEYLKKDEPIYGCAFEFDKEEASFESELQKMKTSFSHNSYDKDQKTTYLQLENGVMGISLQDITGGGRTVSISIQEHE